MVRSLSLLLTVGRVVFAGALMAASAACSSKGPSQTPISLVDGGDGTPDAAVILDAGDEPAVPPNGASRCPAGVCNYQTGAGCAQDAGPSSCVPLPTPDGGAAPACEAAGATAVGGACTQWTDCATGAICVEGVCRKLCCGKDWSGCPAGEHCFTSLGIPQPTLAYVCLPAGDCDPLAPTSCPRTGTECQIVDPTGATACLSAGTRNAGDACDGENPCKGGLLCVSDNCRKLCRAVPGGGAPGCGADEACVHFTRDPAGVGECTPW
jgi:hypothetical protein